MEEETARIAFVLCGALGREVIAIAKRRGWRVAFFGVAASDHLVPQRIAPDVERRLRELIPRFERVVVVYGDCGTAGKLDEVLARFNVPRIEGPHCYEMYAGTAFDALMDEEPGTFFLTDFLVRAFEGTIRRGLGLDRFPELQPIYFGNYRRLVYLAQTEDALLLEQARAIAASLDLPLVVRFSGYGQLEERLAALMAEIHAERYRPVIPPSQEEFRGDLPGAVLARYPAAGARKRGGRARERPAGRPLPGGDRPGRDSGGVDRG